CPALIRGDVQGELVPPIEDGENCTSKSPLRITAIGKEVQIVFNQPVTTNCAMAVSLAEWSIKITNAAHASFGETKKIAGIGTGSDYQCRNVNSTAEGRLSEHAFANALD